MLLQQGLLTSQELQSLAVGAKVIIMLRTNMWVERGYVNSSIDTVSHIIYRQNGPALPDLVICQFPQYTGPPFYPELPFPVPIPSIQRVWTVNATIVFSRTGIPLSLAWAITVHKSQGLTLPKLL